MFRFLWILVIISTPIIEVQTVQLEEVKLQLNSSECQLQNSRLICDYNNSHKSVVLMPLSNDIEEVFIYNVKKLNLSDSECINVTVHDAEEITVKEMFTDMCHSDDVAVRLSIRNSGMNLVPSHVTHLYLESTTLKRFEGTKKLKKMVVISSTIDTIDLKKPFAIGTMAVIQDSIIETLRSLSVEDGSSLLIQESEILNLDASAITIRDAKVVLRDSTFGKSCKDSLVLEHNSILHLDNFKGNLNIRVNATTDPVYAECVNPYLGLFIVFLILFVIISILSGKLLKSFINLKLAENSDHHECTVNQNQEKDPEQQYLSAPNPKGYSPLKFFGFFGENHCENSPSKSTITTGPLSLLKNLEEQNKKQMKDFQQYSATLNDQLSNLKKGVQEDVKKIENNSKEFQISLEKEMKGRMSVIDRGFKITIYNAKNGTHKTILESAKTSEKKYVQLTYEKDSHQIAIKANTEKCDCYRKRIEERKDIVNNLFTEGKRVLSSLDTFRTTCKSFLEGAKEYESILSILTEELDRMLLDGKKSKAIKEGYTENARVKIQKLEEVLHNSREHFEKELDRLNEENESRRKEIDSSVCEEKADLQSKQESMYDCERKRLHEAFEWECTKHIDEQFRSYPELENLKKTFTYQEEQFESMKMIVLLIFRTQAHYIRGGMDNLSYRSNVLPMED